MVEGISSERGVRSLRAMPPRPGEGCCTRRDAWDLIRALTDSKPGVLEHVDAAQICAPSRPPRRDLQYPCRLLP